MTLSKNITQLLIDWSNGDETALHKLMPLVYDELRRIAGTHLRRGRPDNIIQTTVLVHEVFLRLVNQENVSFQTVSLRCNCKQTVSITFRCITANNQWGPSSHFDTFG